MSKVSVALREMVNLHCWAEREERRERKEKAWKSSLPNSSLRYRRQAKGKTTVNKKKESEICSSYNTKTKEAATGMINVGSRGVFISPS